MMARGHIQSLNIAEIQLENIYLAMDRVTFSKSIAASIVGGRQKLLELIAEGKIRAVKGKNTQNSKWKCNAAQVLRHCRNMRKKGLSCP